MEKEKSFLTKDSAKEDFNIYKTEEWDVQMEKYYSRYNPKDEPKPTVFKSMVRSIFKILNIY